MDLAVAAARELVAAKTSVIVAVGPEISLRAALAPNSGLPIVILAFNYDPIARGYVESLAHPGGNITGLFTRQPELAVKQLQLLVEAFQGKIDSGCCGTIRRPSSSRTRRIWTPFSSAVRKAFSKSYGGDVSLIDGHYEVHFLRL